jgi:hypothetical protein
LAKDREKAVSLQDDNKKPYLVWNDGFRSTARLSPGWSLSATHGDKIALLPRPADLQRIRQRLAGLIA